jgi:hypothetical protein
MRLLQHLSASLLKRTPQNYSVFFPAEAQAYSTDPVYLCIFSTLTEQPLSIHRQGEKLSSSILKVNMTMHAVLML